MLYGDGMSIRLMNMVWDNTDEWLSGSRRLVMLALADNANDEFQCWPAIETIAKKANLGTRYTLEILKELTEHGYINRKRRYQTSTLYTLHFNQVSYSAQSEVSPASPISEPRLTSLVSPASLEPSVNHKEPSISEPKVHLTNAQVFFRDLFGMKRLNQVQLEAIAKLETEHGFEKFQEVAKWARLNGMTAGKAIASMTTALPKWGQKKTYNGKPSKAEKPEVFWVDH